MKKTLKVLAVIFAVYYIVSAVICGIIVLVPKVREQYIRFIARYIEWIHKLFQSTRNIFTSKDDEEETQPEAE